MPFIPVLNPTEAETNVAQAAWFLASRGIIISNYRNLRDALIPGKNLRLALMGDSAQRLILILQRMSVGAKQNHFFQQRIFNPVGTNNYLAFMAQEHGLIRYIYITTADLSTHRYIQRNVWADTTEALIGAIFLEGGHQLVNVARFMQIFEVDFDAALRYPRRMVLQGYRARQRIAYLSCLHTNRGI